ncbi:hypothetical protein Ccrd_007015 [Cynara cardunculus var. scolymus]|uniref:Heat shock protein DnaJ, cysteine-rich domain-containing protein n=1 Tax=Cynara cardunculus var. scolymus TaxID=59895 RepID=A0A103XHS7_CYNCS|nr:hypothetical protein Ccrd_007015 [Cynara cardunculus var. scolymus]
MSSSLPLTFNSLISWQKSSRIPSEFNNNAIGFPNFNKPTSLSLSKSHICFTFNNNSSEYEREETRWLREEQRWMREEQRWIREEQRWEAERESLLNEIKTLKLQIEELRREGGNTSVSNVAKLLHVLKKEVNQISDSGSSAAPLVVEAAAAAAAVEDAEEVVVKEVIKVAEETKGRNKDKEVKKKRAMLRVGSEGENGVAVTSVTQVPEILSRVVKEYVEPDVYDNRVFLLGENRWEDSSRLKNRNKQDSQFLEWVGEDTKCPYCEGIGHSICDVCQGTGFTTA